MKIIFIFSFSGMFGDVPDCPECSVFRVLSTPISVCVEGKKFSKRRRHDVLLVLLFWLGALEFTILRFLFFCCLNISSAISPDFQFINL